MALHPNCPTSPDEPLKPDLRCFPAAEAERFELHRPPTFAALASRFKDDQA